MARNVNSEELGPVEMERQLARELQRILARASWLEGWKTGPAPARGPDSGWDLIASGPVPGGKQAALCVECKTHFSPSEFATLAERRCDGGAATVTTRVLAMPNVSPRMAELCQANQWSWFDLAGNCHLEIPGFLLIERTGQEPVRIRRPQGATLRSSEAASVVRALLAPENAGQRWTQREMVSHFAGLGLPGAAPSLALVNKVVQYLTAEAFVEPLPSRGFRVRDPEGLLRVWGAQYRFDRAVRRRYFTLLQGRALQEKLNGLGTAGIAYAVFSAAEIQAPHVRQPRMWLYLAAEREVEVQEAIQAKEVDSGENVVVLIPEDPGVFYRPDLRPLRLPCSNPVQTYVDLLHAGGRGGEAAEALLAQRLRPAWKGETDAR